MTGETTVRHSHRTISSSGASVSEPEVARPLLTADEAMRLGSNEELIFASGRPTIRARKLRHYRERAFKRLAKIPPPRSSDRIEYGAESDTGPATETETPVESMATTTPEMLAPTAAVIAKKAPPTPASAAEQLSFLKFAVENANGSSDAPDAKDAKERLL
jgi:type IV secretory pathway TraG/TraD family ATPase VirD4